MALYNKISIFSFYCVLHSAFSRAILVLFVFSTHSAPLFAQPAGGKISLKDLQGQWTMTNIYHYSYSVTHPGLAPDADNYARSYTTQILVEGDSIWSFEYPCKFYQVQKIAVRSDSLYFDNSPRASGHVRVEDKRIQFSFQPQAPIHGIHEEFWRRDSFDLQLLNKLKKDSVNYLCLFGNLQIVNFYSPGDGSGGDITFPVPLPRYLQFNNEDSMISMVKNNRVFLPVFGVYREFTLKYLQWTNNTGDGLLMTYSYGVTSPEISLVPGNWWKGKDFTVEYHGTTTEPDKKMLAELETSADNIYPENYVFKILNNELINGAAKILDSLGFISDLFVFRQCCENREIKLLDPLKSKSYYYFTPEKKKNPIYNFGALVKTPEWVEAHRHMDPSEIKHIQDIDYTPLTNAKSILNYYFCKKDSDVNAHRVFQGMLEIWIFKNEGDAKSAEAFFSKYLNPEEPRDENCLLYYTGNFRNRIVRKNTIIYYINTDNYEDEMAELFVAFAKCILR